jgi:peptidyl-tRNA hydrolase, PTH1 family
MSDKYLIIGLGNPGREYRLNRHNVGFMTLDRLVETHRLTGFTKMQSKALITTGRVAGAALVLAKPQTYMNLSGQAVGALMRFHEVPLERLLVCSDDIDLPLGTLRLRSEGGSAGQKGLESIIAQLGTKAFPRLRIGIGRPPGVKAAANYVLRDFKGEDLDIIDFTLDRAVEAIESFVRDGLVLTMSRFNGPLDKE